MESAINSLPVVSNLEYDLKRVENAGSVSHMNVQQNPSNGGQDMAIVFFDSHVKCPHLLLQIKETTLLRYEFCTPDMILHKDPYTGSRYSGTSFYFVHVKPP